ncbi:hypothetical protein BGW42_003337 [Actinomortierella wolfii]|nr:hypothetical protein BGW42_003337 [Actinomortierella wolfii]
MDVMLYPLEPGKTVELLLTNVPLTAPEAPNQAQNGTLKIPLRTDVSIGWYRLEIQIWDMGYRHQPDDSEMTPAEIEEQDWRMSKEVAATSAAAVDTTTGAELVAPASIQRTFWSIASWIVSGPGRSRLQKSSTTAANLGNRGREDDGAAQSAATKASHYIENSFYNKRRVAAWRGTEAIEVTTLSHDDPEWNEFMRNSRENLQDRLNHLHADDPAQLSHMLELAHHDTVEYREAAKEYRMPRPYLQFDANEGTVTELDENERGVNDPFTSPIIAIPSSPSAVRTIYDQDLFRYRKEISIVFNRVPPPEPELDEDDLAEIEAAKPEAEKLKEARDREHLEHWVQSWFGSVSEGEDKLNKMAQSQIEERGEETPFVVSHDFSGAGQLQIRIEYMNRILSNERLFTVPANADRVVSWETPDNLLDDKVIFSLELVQLAPEYILSTNNQSSETARSNLLHKALNVPHTALIADRVPASWGAISIRIPSHVTQGPYQIRLYGISKDGRRWADVSQPFMVLNDPFIYSYPPF